MTTLTLPITSANRAEARKFLTAQGMAGAEVRILTIKELNAHVKHYLDRAGSEQPTPANNLTKTEDELYIESYGGRDEVIAWLCTQDEFTENDIKLMTGWNPRNLRQLHQDRYATYLKNLVPHEPKACPIPEPTQPESTPMTTPTVQPEQLAALSTLLSSIMPAQQIDENRIVELIKQHAARPTSIEIKANGETRKVEGAHHKLTPLLIKVLSTRINGKRPSAWLAGPAGSGKTTAAEQVAKALDLPFYSTGAIQTEYKLTGFVNAEGEIVRTPFRDAFEHGGVFLWDEIDGSNLNALVAFNQALANGHCAFPDKMVEKHKDFVAIAAANTFGSGATVQYVGRNRIDAATLDRFVFIEWNYDESLERQIAGNDDWVDIVQAFRRAVDQLNIRHIVSPRASIDGAGLIAAGLSIKETRELVVRKGLDNDQWNKLVSKAQDLFKKAA